MYQDSDHEPCLLMTPLGASLPRQASDPVSAQLIDEEHDTCTLEILQNPALLKAFDDHHDLSDLVARVIIGWYDMGRPPLDAANEMTFYAANKAVSDAIHGAPCTPASYALASAICQATDSTTNRDVKETPAYTALFEAVKTVVEKQGVGK